MKKKLFSKIAVFLLSFFLCAVLSAGEPLKPRLGEAPSKSAPYIFINGDTPGYIIKEAVKKKAGIALYLQGSSAGWIRKHIEQLSGVSILLFVKSPLSDLEKGHLDELVKNSGYNATIVCFEGTCEKEEGWTHQLVRNNYVISWNETKKGPEISMKKRGVVSKGSMLSGTDLKDFRGSPEVTGAVHFKDTGFSFISLDAEGVKVPPEIWTVVYYSKSEKKLKEFVEKKL